jgi:hypothetical protein
VRARVRGCRTDSGAGPRQRSATRGRRPLQTPRHGTCRSFCPTAFAPAVGAPPVIIRYSQTLASHLQHQHQHQRTPWRESAYNKGIFRTTYPRHLAPAFLEVLADQGIVLKIKRQLPHEHTPAATTPVCTKLTRAIGRAVAMPATVQAGKRTFHCRPPRRLLSRQVAGEPGLASSSSAALAPSTTRSRRVGRSPPPWPLPPTSPPAQPHRATALAYASRRGRILIPLHPTMCIRCSSPCDACAAPTSLSHSVPTAAMQRRWRPGLRRTRPSERLAVAHQSPVSCSGRPVGLLPGCCHKRTAATLRLQCTVRME